MTLENSENLKMQLKDLLAMKDNKKQNGETQPLPKL
jgi:hypothetical protein